MLCKSKFEWICKQLDNINLPNDIKTVCHHGFGEYKHTSEFQDRTRATKRSESCNVAYRQRQHLFLILLHTQTHTQTLSLLHTHTSYRTKEWH